MENSKKISTDIQKKTLLEGASQGSNGDSISIKEKKMENSKKISTDIQKINSLPIGVVYVVLGVYKGTSTNGDWYKILLKQSTEDGSATPFYVWAGNTEKRLIKDGAIRKGCEVAPNEKTFKANDGAVITYSYLMDL